MRMGIAVNGASMSVPNLCRAVCVDNDIPHVQHRIATVRHP